MSKKELKIGTGGIPKNAGKSSVEGIIYSAETLKTSTMELEWVRGVRMGHKTISEIKKTCEKYNFSPTAHAPYYINFNSPDKKILDASVYRVADSLNLAYQIGIKSVVFHAGFNHGKTSIDVMPNIISSIKRLNTLIKPEVKKNVKLAIETMGKASQFGSLAECIAIAKEFENVSICLDIAHLLARSRGEQNDYDAFCDIFTRIKKELGQEPLDNLHMHISGIEYGPAGERRHLMLEDSKLNWREFLQAVKDMKISGWLVCESPDAEADYQLLRAEWSRM